jgi:predicted nucleotidyltransferase
VTVDDARLPPAVEALLRSGAVFAYVHGSRARGAARADSDLDLAAWWPGRAPAPFEVDLPAGVDLLVLNSAPLELRGRVAAEGIVVLEADARARVLWESTTRKIWFDERPRFERAHREFAAALASGRLG